MKNALFKSITVLVDTRIIPTRREITASLSKRLDLFQVFMHLKTLFNPYNLHTACFGITLPRIKKTAIIFSSKKNNFDMQQYIFPPPKTLSQKLQHRECLNYSKIQTIIVHVSDPPLLVTQLLIPYSDKGSVAWDRLKQLCLTLQYIVSVC